jgi:hypothetical protein
MLANGMDLKTRAFGIVRGRVCEGRLTLNPRGLPRKRSPEPQPVTAGPAGRFPAALGQGDQSPTPSSARATSSTGCSCGGTERSPSPPPRATAPQGRPRRRLYRTTRLSLEKSSEPKRGRDRRSRSSMRSLRRSTRCPRRAVRPEIPFVAESNPRRFPDAARF